MISLIRKWMFNKSLREHPNYKLKKEHSGVNNCKTICIISNGSNSTCKSATEKYKAKLKSVGKSLDILYFIDDKSETDIGYSLQNIKWYGIPKHEKIDNILGKQFDLLIFLNHEMKDHLRYLVKLCNAKFKIGPDVKDAKHFFDLIIDIKDNTDTDSLIKNIDKQLRQLSI